MSAFTTYPSFPYLIIANNWQFSPFLFSEQSPRPVHQKIK